MDVIDFDFMMIVNLTEKVRENKMEEQYEFLKEKYELLNERLDTIVELYIKLDEKVGQLAEVVASLDSEFEIYEEYER